MTVIQTSVTRAKPGRRHDAVALALEAAKLLERHGATDSRLLTAGAAGENTGTYVFINEFENGEAWGAFSDAINQDAEIEALLDRVNSEQSPVVLESMSIATEIPLGRSGKHGQGPVVEAHISRALPGRFDAALALGRVAFDFLEAQGATNCRLMQLNDAGALSDCLVSSWECESMRIVGAIGDAYFSDPSAQTLLQMLTGPDCPITTISSGIYTQIPL